MFKSAPAASLMKAVFPDSTVILLQFVKDDSEIVLIDDGRTISGTLVKNEKQFAPIDVIPGAIVTDETDDLLFCQQ